MKNLERNCERKFSPVAPVASIAPFVPLLVMLFLGISCGSSLAAQENLSFDLTGSVSGEANGSLENRSSAFSNPDKPLPDAGASASLDGKISFSRGYTALGLLDFTFADSAVLDSNDGATIERLSFKVNELYADLNFGDLVYARAGKQRLSWGAGYVFNPSDPVNPPKDPTASRTALEGVPSLKAEIIAKPVSLMTFAVVHDKLKETGYGAKLSTSVIPNSDVSVSGYWSHSQSWTAALNASVAPLYELPGWDSILVWTEASVYEKDRYASFDAGNPLMPHAEDSSGAETAILAGASAKLPVLNTVVLAEYYHLLEGLSKDQIAAMLASPFWYGELARRPGRLARDYLFISLTQSAITDTGNPVFDKIGLSASCLANLTDLSSYSSGGVSFAFVDNASLGFDAHWANGGRDSEFGNALKRLFGGLKMSVFY